MPADEKHLSPNTEAQLYTGIAERLKELERENELLKAEIQKQKSIAENGKKDEVLRPHDETVETILQRLYAILSNTYSAILLVTDDGYIEFANHAFCDLFCLNDTPEELKGLTSQEMIQKIRAAYAYPDEAVARIARIVSEGKPVKSEEVPMADGKLCLRDYVPIRLAGKSYGRVWYHQDISERKQAEEALRQSEERYRSLHETLRDAFAQTDMYGKIIDFNDAYCRMLGYSPEEITKLTYQELTPERWHAFEEKIVREQIIPRGYSDVYEKEYRRKDGTIIPVELRAILYQDAGGQPAAMWAIVRDITERKKAEAALYESRAKLEAAIESMMDAVVITDGEGKLIELNNAFVTFHRFKSKDDTLELRDAFQMFELFDNDNLLVPVDSWPMVRALRGESGTNERFRVHLKHTDEWLFASYAYAPIRDKDGNIVGSIFAARDITDIELAEEELRKSRDELDLRVQQRTAELQKAYADLQNQMEERERLEEQLRQTHKMEALGTLAGGIAHDFNNMLAVILGNAELALDDISEIASQASGTRDNIEQIIKASKRSRDLVKQILQFSRKDIAQNRKPLKLTSLLNETVSLLRGSIPSTIAIGLNITADLQTILGDSSQIQQVLMNLASNAMQAMEDGGHLTISLSNVTLEEGKLTPEGNLQLGRYVKLSVSDTGTGMSDEVKARIFEPFFTTKGQGVGTGMGLAVAFGIIKSHDGAITVESKEGQGSMFNLFFPVYGEQPAEEDLCTNGSLPTGMERILLVDDEPQVLDMVAKTLRSLGYKVVEEQGGPEAFARFKRDPDAFDLVITDYVMPEWTGIRLAERMLKVRKDIPVILFTGYSDAITPEKARRAGIRSFVMKPVVKKEMAEVVRMVFTLP